MTRTLKLVFVGIVFDPLSEDASSTVLEGYMPHIRQGIYKPLIGLKAKLEPYQITITEKLGGSQTYLSYGPSGLSLCCR